jgi:hypothetical protein
VRDVGQGFDPVDDPWSGSYEGGVGIDGPDGNLRWQHARPHDLFGQLHRSFEPVAAGSDDDNVGLLVGDRRPFDPF